MRETGLARLPVTRWNGGRVTPLDTAPAPVISAVTVTSVGSPRDFFRACADAPPGRSERYGAQCADHQCRPQGSQNPGKADESKCMSRLQIVPGAMVYYPVGIVTRASASTLTAASSGVFTARRMSNQRAKASCSPAGMPVGRHG